MPDSNIVSANTGSSAETSGTGGNVIEMNSSAGDQHNHYSHVQSNGVGSAVSGSGSVNNSSVNSSQLFHSHQNMGHFTPSAAYISGNGYGF